MGISLGIPEVSEDRCGKPPDDIIWIMSGKGRVMLEGKLQWADCSIEAFKRKKASLACLRKTIDSSRAICGNGLVEGDEQCDCFMGDCKKCCDETCKLFENSTCSNGPCCDASKCQFFNNTQQCRTSDDFCDIPELCDGNSSKCPDNYVVANGYACQGSSGDKGYCFNGICGNPKDVCEWAFLNGSSAPDKCFDNNEQDGTEWGGCGPTFQSKKNGGPSYTACKKGNKFCGKIYCTQPGIESKMSMNYTPESSPYFEGEFEL